MIPPGDESFREEDSENGSEICALVPRQIRVVPSSVRCAERDDANDVDDGRASCSRPHRSDASNATYPNQIIFGRGGGYVWASWSRWRTALALALTLYVSASVFRDIRSVAFAWSGGGVAAADGRSAGTVEFAYSATSAAAGVEGVSPDELDLGVAGETSSSLHSVVPAPSDDDDIGPDPVFLFVIGVEGSGHHLFDSIYLRSPSYRRLVRWGLAEKVDGPYKRLLASLWDHKNATAGLLSAHCSSLERMGHPDGEELLRNVAKLLTEMKSAVRENYELDNVVLGGNTSDERQQGQRRTAVALNSISVNMQAQGMLSYPDWITKCRYLSYPDISLLYDACDLAGADCRHAVLVREPYSVLRSGSMNRKFDTKLIHLKLMTTMLQVIYGQISEQPERLAACWDYDNSPTQEEKGGGRIGGGVSELGRLLGWDDHKKFEEVYGEIYKRGSPMDNATRDEIVERALQPFMRTMVRSTEEVKHRCREIYHAFL